METNNDPIIKRPVIEIKQEGNIFFTEDFMHQIKYLCDKISQVEWSGLLFYKVEGNMQDLKHFTVEPYYIHLMDKGTGGTTEFDDDGSMAELYKQKPELDPFEEGEVYLYGKIHSHHSMGVFHSSTDHQDLQDQGGKFDPYYLSVIVNNYLDLEAKIAFVGKIPKQVIKPNKFKGEKNWALAEREVLGIVDLEVYTEETIISVSDDFKARTKAIMTAPYVHKSTYTPGFKPSYKNNNFPGRQMGMLPAETGPSLAEIAKEAERLEEAEVLAELGEEQRELTMLDFLQGGEHFADADILTVRFNYGRKALEDFLAAYFKEPYALNAALEEIDKATITDTTLLMGKTVTWFRALNIWAQQNVIIYLEEANKGKKDLSPNLSMFISSIFDEIKAKV